jgi:2-phospho-L-lactate/phosphoenolpyruvate guanylyltransferase
VQWTVLVPAKTLPAAKSRLLSVSPHLRAHHELVRAIRQDTADAAAAAQGVARVLLLVDRGAAQDDAIVQSAPGLNNAVVEAAAHATRNWPADGVAVLMGDLPALRPDELAAALSLASVHPCAFVADWHGTGTTMLTARPGAQIQPEFGANSAVRHARNAAALDAGAGLRHDVDTADDLRAAAALGLGPATTAALRDADLQLGAVSSPFPGIMNP